MKKFIRGFLDLTQNHGNLIQDVERFNSHNSEQADIDVNRLQNIIKLVVKILWNVVSNKSDTKDTNGMKFSEDYLANIVFKFIKLENLIYARLNPMLIQRIITKLSELSPEKFSVQFKAIF